MTEQAPLNSGFGAGTTAAQAVAGIDLSGKTAVVTGGYTGLGLETVRALAGAGAQVIVGGRSPDKAGALAGIAGVRFMPLDLAEPASIQDFAAGVVATGAPISILINNAAIMACPLARDARGYESQFATNHLGHFALIVGLWPALAKANGARVVCLSSIGHRISGVDFADPHFVQRPYDKWVAYGQAKSANSLCAVELDRRGQAHGVRAFSVHPGGIMTELQRSLPREEMIAFGWIDAAGTVNPRFKSTEQGAATSVWAATSPLLAGKGGVYCEDCDVSVAVAVDDKAFTGVRPQAIDRDAAARLWALSEAQTGVVSQV
ncbi:MAG: oxidoreductase [Caulobacterales bacterium]|jgi:NAD(P)-dependent dehydrogenase (short-subunit alcohol dehydrogenase family)